LGNINSDNGGPRVGSDNEDLSLGKRGRNRTTGGGMGDNLRSPSVGTNAAED